MPEQF